MTPGSIIGLWYSTPRALVNASKPQRPWYLPMPELPTPPNGSSGISGWTVQSLTQASPGVRRLEDLLDDGLVLGEHVQAERPRAAR